MSSTTVAGAFRRVRRLRPQGMGENAPTRQETHLAGPMGARSSNCPSTTRSSPDVGPPHLLFADFRPKRSDKNPCEKNDYAEPDVESREDPGREIVEYYAPDDSRDERQVLIVTLAGRHPQPVFPIRQRAGDPEYGFARDIKNQTEMDDSEDHISHPAPLEEGPRQDGQLSCDTERDDPEMDDDDHVGEKCVHGVNRTGPRRRSSYLPL